MKFKKGDLVRLASKRYLNHRAQRTGLVIEVRDKGDNLVPVHRIKWITQYQHEWHYAEDLCLIK